MAIRELGQLGLADALAPRHGGVKLAELDALIDWSSIAALLSHLHGSTLGAPAYPPLVMLKAHLLQQWYALSDPGLEEALADRLSFRRFVGLSLGDATPDHSSIWRFRKALADAGLAERVFDEVTRQIDRRGLILRQGTMIDATLVEAQVRRPKPPREDTPKEDRPKEDRPKEDRPKEDRPKEDRPMDGAPFGDSDGAGDAASPPGTASRAPSKLVSSPLDPDASWAKKGGVRTFGYKGHVAVDLGSGVIRRAVLTTASVADTTQADAMILCDERAVYADKAYDTKARRVRLKSAGIKDRIAHRPNKHHPLSHRQMQRNDGIARLRSGVERVFAIAKCRMGWRRVRYRGLERNATHFLLMCMAMNLDRLRVMST